MERKPKPVNWELTTKDCVIITLVMLVILAIRLSGVIKAS